MGGIKGTKTTKITRLEKADVSCTYCGNPLLDPNNDDFPVPDAFTCGVFGLPNAIVGERPRERDAMTTRVAMIAIDEDPVGLDGYTIFTRGKD